jgi:hypothetical protein
MKDRFMNRVRNYLAAMAAAALLALILSLSNSNNVSAQLSAPDNVKVVNTSREPVPTTVQNAVKLATDNIVGINPSSNTVQVGNSESNPALVRNVEDARQPFQQMLDFDFADGQITRSVSLSIPSGKRLVIEYASASLGVGQGQAIVHIEINTTVEGVSAGHFLMAASQGTGAGGNGVFGASQQMRVYADDGLFVNVQRNNGSGTAGGRVTLSGYLVDLP